MKVLESKNELLNQPWNTVNLKIVPIRKSGTLTFFQFDRNRFIRPALNGQEMVDIQLKVTSDQDVYVFKINAEPLVKDSLDNQQTVKKAQKLAQSRSRKPKELKTIIRK